MRRNERPQTHRSSSAPKSSRAFDAFALVQQRGAVRGELRAGELRRLADRLADDGGRIRYELTGTTDEANRPALDVRIDGELRLTCQRCLQPMAWPAAQRITVLLARDQRELALLDDSDEREVMLADAPVDPLELVEDELLLTMPYAPRHPQVEGAQCVPAAGDERHAAKPASPFGALAGLKAQSDKG